VLAPFRACSARPAREAAKQSVQVTASATLRFRKDHDPKLSAQR
jgi:hypothetical protein